MNKKCFKCNRIKPIDQFYSHRQMKDGHLNKCKNCTKKGVRNRYRDPQKIEQIREYERLRFKNPKRKAKILLYQRKRRITYKGKERARKAVFKAIKNGQLVRLPCEKCGDLRSHAHHKDYRKYLDVLWLCRKHHWEEHQKSYPHNQLTVLPTA